MGDKLDILPGQIGGLRDIAVTVGFALAAEGVEGAVAIATGIEVTGGGDKPVTEVVVAVQAEGVQVIRGVLSAAGAKSGVQIALLADIGGSTVEAPGEISLLKLSHKACAVTADIIDTPAAWRQVKMVVEVNCLTVAIQQAAGLPGITAGSHRP